MPHPQNRLRAPLPRHPHQPLGPQAESPVTQCPQGEASEHRPSHAAESLGTGDAATTGTKCKVWEGKPDRQQGEGALPGVHPAHGRALTRSQRTLGGQGKARRWQRRVVSIKFSAKPKAYMPLTQQSPLPAGPKDVPKSRTMAVARILASAPGCDGLGLQASPPCAAGEAGSRSCEERERGAGAHDGRAAGAQDGTDARDVATSTGEEPALKPSRPILTEHTTHVAGTLEPPTSQHEQRQRTEEADAF